MRILVTGASGFIGRAIVSRCARTAEHRVRCAVRRPCPALPAGVELVTVGDLGPDTDWGEAVRDVDVIVHAAGRGQVMRDRAVDPLVEYRHSNALGTLNLARQAAVAGARRLIFISSIKVNGEETRAGRPFTADDPPAPTEAYGISKHEAEIALRKIANETRLSVVIIRPVLVYGPGVKGNFAAILRALHRGVPLPLGAIHNQRSLVGLGNLVDLVATCLDHPAASNQTLLVSDREDLSTTELAIRAAAALGRPARLIPIPMQVLRFGARILGRTESARRLCGSLQVDIGKTQSLLGWRPAVTVDEQLRQTAQYFLAEESRRDGRSRDSD
jgi:nucleoside-diphosphate-sugar epimerase